MKTRLRWTQIVVQHLYLEPDDTDFWPAKAANVLRSFALTDPDYEIAGFKNFVSHSGQMPWVIFVFEFAVIYFSI